MWSVPVVVAAAAAPMASASAVPDMTVAVVAGGSGGSFVLTYLVTNIGMGATDGSIPIVLHIAAVDSWTESGPPSGAGWVIAPGLNPGEYTATWTGGTLTSGGNLPEITWSGSLLNDVQVTAAADVEPGSGGETNSTNNHDEESLFWTLAGGGSGFGFSLITGPCTPSQDPAPPAVIGAMLRALVTDGSSSFAAGDVVEIYAFGNGSFTTAPPTGWVQSGSAPGTLTYVFDGTGSGSLADFSVGFVPAVAGECLWIGGKLSTGGTDYYVYNTQLCCP